ncbi:MAG: putative manganese-dependent inorganic diphosphatase [Opitutaceae bacterium]|jgi:manganese-dependent inorganic pyrophosphatase|nr:putative manganese-dependent inorganic diphosphatase [Opitutaceae bacterium]
MPAIHIIGHRNPDADSICSAIGYARLKNILAPQTTHIPARCGNTNARIDTILERFRQPAPLHLPDVTPRVRDVMTTRVISITPGATCAEALEMIEKNNIRVLPVAETGGRLLGSVSVFQLGAHLAPAPGGPPAMRRVKTSLACVIRALGATTLHTEDPDRPEDLYVRVGAMSLPSFERTLDGDGIPLAQSVVLVGDREDIQRLCIRRRVRALIVSGGLPVSPEIAALAREHAVSLIVSPRDTATTAWLIRYAALLDGAIDRDLRVLDGDQRLDEVRPRLAASPRAAHMVADANGNLAGILSKTDLLKPSKTRLILVDHNELAQAVPGAGSVHIEEIIDHHRLATPPTARPILFINEPVGSTCTIIAGLYRNHHLEPEPAIAGVLMSGIIADTLNLASPTTTQKDTVLLDWLARLAGADPARLAARIFSSGSIILANSPEGVIGADLKRYTDGSLRYAVSQVEELGFRNFNARFAPLAAALEKLRADENLNLALLLVTDINTQNSLLLARGDPAILSHIHYPPGAEHPGTFEAPGIVSRKKQLIPYLTTLFQQLRAEGRLPA